MAPNETKKAARFAPKVTIAPASGNRTLRSSVIIGALALMAVAGLSFYVLFFQSNQNIEIELTSVSANQEGRLELQGLTYRGKTQAGDPFEVNADKAAEDASNTQIVNLTKVDGLITSAKNGRVTLASLTGRFHQGNNYVSLTGDVIITQTMRQLVFETQALEGDLTLGNFEAPNDVHLTSPTTSITAEAMSVVDFGDKITFKGQSKAIINEDK